LIGHEKPENKWFYGEEFLAKDGVVVPQVLADEPIRQREGSKNVRDMQTLV
jgi:hypothetical protein